jgi:hypothetical protein
VPFSSSEHAPIIWSSKEAATPSNTAFDVRAYLARRIRRASVGPRQLLENAGDRFRRGPGATAAARCDRRAGDTNWHGGGRDLALRRAFDSQQAGMYERAGLSGAELVNDPRENQSLIEKPVRCYLRRYLWPTSDRTVFE